MLYLPDFKEKSLLFIDATDIKENKLRFSNDNIVFSKDGAVENRMSCHKVFAVFIMGDVSITSILIKNCLKYGISLFLLDGGLKLYGMFGAKAEGNYLLRMKQYACKQALPIAKHLIKNKVRNQLRLLRQKRFIDKEQYLRDKKALFSRVDYVSNCQELLGVEGSQQKNFYKVYFNQMGWYKRMSRSKVDEYNLLLDIGYTFLFNYCDSILRIYGFDTYKGFYHTLFFQRKSLACDIMEPFRCIIDKQLLKSFCLEQINKKDFNLQKGVYSLGYKTSGKYAKIFLEAIASRKEDIFQFITSFYKAILNETLDLPVFKV